MTDIIPASAIDYRNVDEIIGYRLLLCKIYEREGGFSLPLKSTPVIREIDRQALVWLREVKTLIESILSAPIPDSTHLSPNLADMPALVSGYDMIYRIAHGGPCHDYMREVALRTADRWLKGDKSISKTDVVLLLLTEADRDIRTLDKRYAQYALSMMAEWVDQLIDCGTFTDATPAETYRRLAYILHADLSAYTGRKAQPKCKSRWASAHLLTDTQLDALDTATLWAYAAFIQSMPYATPAEYQHNDTLYTRTLAKIATRPDIHPHATKALALTPSRPAPLIA